MTKRSTKHTAVVRRAVKIASTRPDRIISSGEVAYAQLRSPRAVEYDFEFAQAIRASGKFERVLGPMHYSGRMTDVTLFKLKESSNV